MREEPVKWTFIFIAVSVIGFIFKQSTELWVYLSFVPAYAFEYPWMFVTSIFLHADFSHLFFNMIALFFFGIYLERIIGGRAFAALFIIAGIFGNLTHLVIVSGAFEPWNIIYPLPGEIRPPLIGVLPMTIDSLIPVVGASGAVYGIIGALAVLAPFMMLFIYGMIPMPMIAAAVFYALLDFAGLFTPSGVAHGAHLGGMIIGIMLGLYLRLRVRRRTIII